jgi:transcriptional regulator with XRE-family HTH domain
VVTKMSELRRLRRDRNLSQRELAEKAGVSKFTVYSAEGGRHVPHYENLVKLANALGVELEAILPKGTAPQSGSDYDNEAGGRTQFRTSGSHMGVVTSKASATVNVSVETLRTALHAVEAGLLSADAAEERLLASVA